MRRPLVLIACLALAAAPLQAMEATALTLADCYALALKRSETIAVQHELIKETEARMLQALSTALPKASYEVSYTRQDGSGSSAFTLNELRERKFVFTQPLFSGFKEFAALTGAGAERKQREHEEARARQLLFVDVSDAFYLLLQQREDLRTLETIRSTLLERIEDLKARERLGRSRPSEVVSVEAQLRRLDADLEGARSQEATARQLLEFLTGSSRIEAIADADPLPPVAAEDAYLQRADDRPDVRASEEAYRVAKKTVLVARGDFWPQVDLESNYYTKRTGVASDVDWDVLLMVDVPLFQGGQTLGAVKEAQAKARAAQLTYERTRREARLEIQQAYTELQAAQRRHEALRQALDAAEENLRLQSEDYRLNLVSNLDVLQALETVEGARRDASSSTYDVKRLRRQLQVAVGETL